jgi:GTP pyrophosphokinase
MTAVYPGLKQPQRKDGGADVVPISRARNKAAADAAKAKKEPAGSQIAIRGLIPGMAVHFARCCHPLPGEEIVGFITRGRGVTVHTAGCSAVMESDPHRRVEVSWQDGGQAPRAVKIDVSCIDRPGLLAAISAAITGAEVNIARAQVRTFPDQKALNTFEVMITDSKQLKRVLASIAKVKGVYKATRAKG